jgi:hypothetical protein
MFKPPGSRHFYNTAGIRRHFTPLFDGRLYNQGKIAK